MYFIPVQMNITYEIDGIGNNKRTLRRKQAKTIFDK